MKRLFGGILLAAGILIMTVSGLCTAFVVIGGFAAALREPSVILLPAMFGGIPLLTGFGLFRAGRTLLRQADEE